MDDAPAHGTLVVLPHASSAEWAGIQTYPVTVRKASEHRRALVRISHDETRHSVVNTRAPGIVQKIAVDVGDFIDVDQALATLYSAEVAALRARIVAQKSRIKVAKANHAREVELGRRGVGPVKDELAARRELDEARAEYEMSLAALAIFGDGDGGEYTMVSPISGTVVSRRATVGQMTGTEDTLFEVVDTSVVWAIVDVPEHSLGATSLGQRVRMEFRSLDERPFEGTITAISPEVDPHTRTARARVPLPNPDGVLRVNMYGEAILEAPVVESMIVPSSAVQRAEGRDFVFVALADGTYEARRVEVSGRHDDGISLLSGVKAGEHVVTIGSFFLKTEILSGAIGAGCCE